MPLTGRAKRRYNKTHYQRRRAEQVGAAVPTVYVSIRIPESLSGQVSRHVEERMGGKTAFPWKTRNSAYAGLIAKGLEKIAEEMPELEIDLAFIKLHHRVMQHRQLRLDAMSLLATTREEVRAYLAAGSTVEAGQHFHTMLAEMKQMPKRFWNEHLVEQMEKAFPDLAAQEPKGVRLMVSKKKGKQ